MKNVIDFAAARARIEAMAEVTLTLEPFRPTLLEQLRVRLTEQELAELIATTLEEVK